MELTIEDVKKLAEVGGGSGGSFDPGNWPDLGFEETAEEWLLDTNDWISLDPETGAWCVFMHFTEDKPARTEVTDLKDLLAVRDGYLLSFMKDDDGSSYWDMYDMGETLSVAQVARAAAAIAVSLRV